MPSFLRLITEAETTQKQSRRLPMGLRISTMGTIVVFLYSVPIFLTPAGRGPDFDPGFTEYGVNYPGKLKPYCDTIDSMLSARKTFREIAEKIRADGFCGSDSTIRMYATRKRRHNQAAMAEFRENSEVIEREYLLKLLYNPIEKVKGITQQQLDKVIEKYPQLTAVKELFLGACKSCFCLRLRFSTMGRHIR